MNRSSRFWGAASPDQTRLKLTATALREHLVQRSDVERLDHLLAHLVNARLLHHEVQEGVALYELAHDYLIGEVRAWVTPADLAARQARDAIRRALADWREHHAPMKAETLAFVHTQREHLAGLTREELDLLLRSAVHHRAALATWVVAAHRGGLDLWPVLRPVLAAPQHHVRAQAVAALAGLGAVALPPLCAALRDPIVPVRVQAIRALAQMADLALRQHLCYEVYIPPHAAQPTCYIDRYPVTTSDYAVFLADQPAYPPPDDWEARQPPPSRLRPPWWA